jgi:hypothetical protein
MALSQFANAKEVPSMNSASAIAAMAFAVAITVAITGCTSNDLTNDQAKTLLNDYFAQNPVTQPLLTGMDNIGTVAEADYFATPGGKYQKALEADGLVTIASKGKIVNPADRKEFFNALDVELTDKGRALTTGKPNTVAATSPNTWPIVYENVIFCGKEVAGITSVATNDDSASADYSWRAAKLSPFANHFHETDPTDKTTCNPAVTVNASAAFERKNGMWTLTVAQ